jgi:hypothetical protein
MPVGVVISKSDRDNPGAVAAAVQVLRGAAPPRRAGKEEPYDESLIHLAYLYRRLLSGARGVRGFAVSALESLREGGALTDKQARALDEAFAPNGSGLDVEAPLRWCLGEARFL